MNPNALIFYRDHGSNFSSRKNLHEFYLPFHAKIAATVGTQPLGELFKLMLAWTYAIERINGDAGGLEREVPVSTPVTRRLTQQHRSELIQFQRGLANTSKLFEHGLQVDLQDSFRTTKARPSVIGHLNISLWSPKQLSVKLAAIGGERILHPGLNILRLEVKKGQPLQFVSSEPNCKLIIDQLKLI